jgi:uncharacterized damage-inducible protein DinB
LLETWAQASRKAEQLAEALPGEKFEWRPKPGIRTCGEVIRHIAFWNQYLADSLRGEEANDASNELPLADYPTKATALEILQRSAADVAAAIREHQGLLNLKKAGLVMSFIVHTSEHYGQLVVYGRLMEIVPTVSHS